MHYTWWKNTKGVSFLTEIKQDLEVNSSGHGNRGMLLTMMLMKMAMTTMDTGFSIRGFKIQTIEGGPQ